MKIRPLSEIKPDYNYLLGFHTGVPKKWWYGIEGITSIFMGDWSDPLIGYREHAFNQFDILDCFWDRYNEEYPAPADYHSEEYQKYESDFAEYMQEHRTEIFEMLDDMLAETNVLCA